MDCCGTSKPEETEKDVKTGKVTDENNPPKEHNHGGCCGGSSGMWLHMAVMLVVFIGIWYFSKG